jgi:proteasome lid subunit RPN8/RPN11
MLRIPQRVYEQIRRYGEDTYPDECCGIFLGTARDDERCVVSAIPCRNLKTDSAATRYEVDPRELLRAEYGAREHGLEIVGFYHSHPDHRAHWSGTDLAEAHWYGCSYVITSVDSGRSGATNSFVLAGSGEEDKVFLDEEVEVLPAAVSNVQRRAS